MEKDNIENDIILMIAYYDEQVEKDKTNLKVFAILGLIVMVVASLILFSSKSTFFEFSGVRNLAKIAILVLIALAAFIPVLLINLSKSNNVNNAIAFRNRLIKASNINKANDLVNEIKSINSNVSNCKEVIEAKLRLVKALTD